MSSQPRPKPRTMVDLLFAMAGPIVWAIHFFGLYLAEAYLCLPALSAEGVIVRPIAVILTAIAVAMLIWLRLNAPITSQASGGTLGALSFKRPLIDISIVAVLWTSIPLFLIEACGPRIG